MSAIEQGVFTPTVQKRLMDLEEDEKRIAARVSILDTQLQQQPTRDDIIALLSLYQDGNPEDKNYQESILDTFLRAAYVYDDHFDLVFSLGDKSHTQTVPIPSDLSQTLSETIKSSYSGSDGSPIGHIRTRRAEIVMIFDLFALRCAYGGKEIHT